MRSIKPLVVLTSIVYMFMSFFFAFLFSYDGNGVQMGIHLFLILLVLIFMIIFLIKQNIYWWLPVLLVNIVLFRSGTYFYRSFLIPAILVIIVVVNLILIYKYVTANDGTETNKVDTTPLNQEKYFLILLILQCSIGIVIELMFVTVYVLELGVDVTNMGMMAIVVITGIVSYYVYKKSNSRAILFVDGAVLCITTGGFIFYGAPFYVFTIGLLVGFVIGFIRYFSNGDNERGS